MHAEDNNIEYMYYRLGRDNLSISKTTMSCFLDLRLASTGRADHLFSLNVNGVGLLTERDVS